MTEPKRKPKNGLTEILIIEDSPTQAARLEYILQQAGYKVTAATNGKEAIGYISRRKPTLIISDILMPEMDGYELCKRLKSDASLSAIPVILLTTLTDPTDVVRGLECGADHFITKPYDEKMLISRIHGVLSNLELRKTQKMGMGVEILIAGQRYFITSDRMQILDFLISTYETAVQQNRELTETRDKLHELNEKLEEKVKERTSELIAEVAQRIKAEERIEHLNNMLRSLRNVNQLITKENDRDKLLKGACTTMTDTHGFRSAWIALIDSAGKLLFATESGLGKDFLPMRKQLERDMPPKCFRQGLKQPGLLLIDSSRDCIDCPLEKIHGDKLAVSAILRYGTQTYGILNVRLPDNIPADLEEQSLFQELADDIAFGLYKIEMAEQRKKAEDDLRSEHTMLARTEQIANIGSWEWDIDTDTVTWSDELFRIFQRDPQEGAPSYAEHPAFYHPDDFALLQQAVEAAVANGTPYELELRAIRKDGNTRVCVARGVAEMGSGGRPVRLFGSLQDITERKVLEQEYQVIIRTTVDGFWQADMQGRFLDVNDSYCHLTGYSRDELLNMAITDIEAIEELEETAKRIQRIKEVGSDSFETRHRCKDGKIVDVEISVNYLPIGHGRMVVFIRDITERKRAEKALRESEDRFRVAQEMSPDGFTILHPLRNEKGEIIDFTWVYENRTIARINGTDPEEVKGKRLFDLFPAHKGTSIFEAYIDVSNSGRPQIIEEVYVGEVVSRPTWLRLVVVSMGEYIAILAQDITERKRAEKSLRESEAQYRLLAEHTTDVIRILDMDLKTTYLSPSAEKLRGFTLQEMVEMPLERQLTPESLSTAYAILSEEISRVEADPGYNSIITLDLEYYCKDGTTIWTESKFSLIRDENGRAVSILAEARDISERKQAEEKLLKSYESLEKTLNNAIDTMVKIVELRDPYTAGHQHRVADLAVAIAGEMKLEETQIGHLRMAAVIHDIGKIYIPSDILSKPGKLADLEFSLVKTHAQAGFDIVKGMDFPGAVAETVLQHHERLDGSGYPNGLKADDTLMKAKILAVADVVEAMSSHRPYRPTLGIDKALEEISKNKGRLYDSDVVDTCLELFTEKGFKFEG